MPIYDVNGNVLLDTPDEELEDLLPDRLLIWHDEFDKPYINKEKWSNLYGRGITMTNMSYVEDLDKVSNVNQGLVYRTIRDNPHPADGIPWSAPFLHTNNKFEFRYGRIEAKIRFPSANPHHSTFWMLGANTERLSINETTQWDASEGVLFPSCGEIDIAEYDNGSVGARTHWSTNGFDSDTGITMGANVGSLTGTPTSWHIYSCEWTDTQIKFYLDGVEKKTWDISNATVGDWNPFVHPHFLILNCIPRLTGTPAWDVADTEVKWVRVYAPVDVASPIIETAISIPDNASITIGERYWLGTPVFTPANPSDMTVKWLSHDENVVTCYGGMLIGKSAGTTYVQATSKNGCIALCKVTVA